MTTRSLHMMLPGVEWLRHCLICDLITCTELSNFEFLAFEGGSKVLTDTLAALDEFGEPCEMKSHGVGRFYMTVLEELRQWSAFK